MTTGIDLVRVCETFVPKRCLSSLLQIPMYEVLKPLPNHKSRGVWRLYPTARNEAVDTDGKGNLASSLYLRVRNVLQVICVRNPREE